MVEVDTQADIDLIWDSLIADGGAPIECGWLRDKYGLRWQIVPARLGELLSHPEAGGRVMTAMLGMQKIDIAGLEVAAATR